MKKIFPLLFFVFLTSSAIAQIRFEPGYIVFNDGRRINCLIRNADPRVNPVEVKYKEEGKDVIVTTSINALKEFGIGGDVVFRKALVNVEHSSDVLQELSSERGPIYRQDTVFLRLCVSGPASLFSLTNKEKVQFYVQVGDGEITHLLYKRYLHYDPTSSAEVVAENSLYKGVLQAMLACNGLPYSSFEKLTYTLQSLSKLIQEYNYCVGGPAAQGRPMDGRKADFNLTVRPGLSDARMTNDNALGRAFDFDTKSVSGFRFGIEAEIILNFGKGKWALFTEPTFQSFETAVDNSTFDVNIQYKSLEIPLGLRHYFFLSDKDKLFINGAFVVDFPLSESLAAYEGGSALSINKSYSAAAGLGAIFRNRFVIEGRHYWGRNPFSNYVAHVGTFSRTEVALGVRIF